MSSSPTSRLAVSFGTAADEYDRYRARPSARALDWLLPAGCRSVLDLGAGTGLLTRQLVERVQDVSAVEPDARMREVLGRNCPGVSALEGRADKIPHPDGRFDAVMVAAAWHWMDPVTALPEIARVLARGGTLGILWTRRDRRVSWLDSLDAFAYEELGGADHVGDLIRQMAEKPWLPQGVPFGEPTPHILSWTTPMTVEEVLGVFVTYARYLVMPADQQKEVAARIEAKIRETAPLQDGVVQMPMVCHCWRLRRDG